MKVLDVMTTDVATVNPTTRFKHVVELLLARDISGVPVVDLDGSLVGVVTEADLLSRDAYPHDRPPSTAALAAIVSGRQRHWATAADGLTAGEFMTRDVITCRPGEDIHTVARRMLDHDVKRLPVVVDGKLIGIVSRQDVLATFARADDEIAAELRRFIDSPVLARQDHHIDVTVADGVVTLAGDVHHHGDAVVLGSLVANFRGVVDVVNELRVVEPSDMARITV